MLTWGHQLCGGLQCVAVFSRVCCLGNMIAKDSSVLHNTLQHTATHCNTQQHSASNCNTLQHTATHYTTSQHTATLTLQRCNTCNTLQHRRRINLCLAIHCNNHTATHCIALQRAATHCNTLHHTATHCNTLQHRRRITLHIRTHCSTHIATRCNALQHAATRCNTHTIQKLEDVWRRINYRSKFLKNLLTPKYTL